MTDEHGAPDAATMMAGFDLAAHPLDAAHDVLTKYVVFPIAEAEDGVTLWSAATHVQAGATFAPRLNIKSPVKRCGKTRLLDVLEGLVHEPLLAGSISAAALARSLGGDPPTLMLDEADTVFGRAMRGDEKAEDLKNILNNGFVRDRPYIRWDAVGRKREECPTFGIACLAGIGDLPDTITDRAIVIALQRQAPGERAAKYRYRTDRSTVAEIGKRLGDWLTPRAVELGEAKPVMPPGLDDRAEDKWELLFAIADLAGGDWPARARRAAVKLSTADETDTSVGARLLADLRDIFDKHDQDGMWTETILGALHQISEAPWSDYYGRLLNARDLARLLRPYEVRSEQVKLDGKNLWGYKRERLHDAWLRYLPPRPEASATSTTSATPQLRDHDQVVGSVQRTLHTTSTTPLTRAVAEVVEVADTSRATDTEQQLSGCPGRPAAPACTVCGEPLDQALADAGDSTHPSCDPDEEPF